MELKDVFLKASEPAKEKVVLSGHDFWVHELTADERDEFEAFVGRHQREQVEKIRAAVEKGETAPDLSKSTKSRFRAIMLMFMVRDENGDRVFSESDLDDLGKRSWRAMLPLVMAANRMSNRTQPRIPISTGVMV